MGAVRLTFLSCAVALAGCRAAPGSIELGGRPDALAYEFHDATLTRNVDGVWFVTLVRHDRSGGPQIRSYNDVIVESLRIPIGKRLEKDARFEFSSGAPIRFWHEPMAPGTFEAYPEGDVVVEAWNPKKRFLSGRFRAILFKRSMTGRFDFSVRDEASSAPERAE